jgi:uroporphyrinogen-III decarboxylase
MSITDRDVLYALCERQMKVILNTLQWLLAQGVGPYFDMAGQERIVPPLHGPVDFDDFNARYDRPIVDAIHDAGGRVHVHCHSDIKLVLASFCEVGIDVLHPFEAPPMGDITPREAKEIARGRLCLEGNIQIHHMYEHTPQQVADETAALIEDTFDDRAGLIVSPTASPYIYGLGEACFGTYKAMVDTVLAWRG